MLVQTNAFIVLERGKMEGILQEQGFQQTGCTSTECVVEMGKLLNVQKIISGSIGKVGKIYTIDISLIDINTARIDKSFMFDHEGELGGLLKLMETTASDIAISVTGSLKVEVKIDMFGSIEIKTKPKKANVYLDNKLIGPSPIKLNEIAVGTHTIQVKAKGYDPAEKNVAIKEQEKSKVEIKLKKLYSLSVQSDPSGAQVLINKKIAGKTPYTATVKEDMKFELKLVMENYQVWQKKIKVDDNIKINEKLKFTKKYKQALAAELKRKRDLEKKAKEEKELAAKAKKEEREKATVQKKKGGSGSKWLWIGGGAAILAGGAAFYILSQKDEEEKKDEGMPLPVGRPN